jgi:hypothetical protein
LKENDVNHKYEGSVMFANCNLLHRATGKIFTGTPFTGEVTDLATLRVGTVAGWSLTASIRVEMGESGSTVAIVRNSLFVNMVHCEVG